MIKDRMLEKEFKFFVRFASKLNKSNRFNLNFKTFSWESIGKICKCSASVLTADFSQFELQTKHLSGDSVNTNEKSWKN